MKKHTFHIPVMGIGFTIDTPLKVSHLGIDSVISLVDDILMEKLRKMYSEKLELPFQEISNKVEDFRAKRITSYLNLINDLAEKKFNEIKTAAVEKSHEVKDYFNMLPDSVELKHEFNSLMSKHLHIDEFRSWVNENMKMGNIDVNIMTKIDKDNYKGFDKLPIEYNDAHAALRGFASSKLKSSVVLSAGMNPRLYSYIQSFDDFFPDQDGNIKKKIILKVSDYRSAMIQGKFFAKKGLWVSEYRIESGLNCGGHAFATDGYLLGPILQEFKSNRETLKDEVFGIFCESLVKLNKTVPTKAIPLRITAQGGVGSSEEHEFLQDQYGIDSVGWGSPFLLVPEVTNVDEYTIRELADAKEEDLHLSDISPLGVPFNNLRGNTKDIEKYALVNKGKPGSMCPKKYLMSNTEFTDRVICTASYRYQNKKIKQLKNLQLSADDYTEKYDKIVEKSCICVGLGTAALLKNKMETKVEGNGVSVCPGPNIAYFSTITSLKTMVDHIYGRINLIKRVDRPNMFVKELGMYIDYLKGKIDEAYEQNNINDKYLIKFANNLKSGISYYHDMFEGAKDRFESTKSNIIQDLNQYSEDLHRLILQIESQSNMNAIAVKLTK
ncbi:MAG: hypothetical protein HN336_05830 [Lentimicrobiaceae bacterium]|jgi:hypothetical protein|nr:hypothetical protein [Lentimicrobiaceae bacterium]MBT3454957.1 hypothetical protein [Lentimicrobiaceae bacterium]MBT3818417.1 hypothetical protein [Lentimicrobiaceae bacterium]MBT4060785.1 hypothetical protein [Lentimicrobiaceae bacterium]MBT4190458.1 hypothetical protein [Lentimicrobiaceae bacterium]